MARGISGAPPHMRTFRELFRPKGVYPEREPADTVTCEQVTTFSDTTDTRNGYPSAREAEAERAGEKQREIPSTATALAHLRVGTGGEHRAAAGEDGVDLRLGAAGDAANGDAALRGLCFMCV